MKWNDNNTIEVIPTKRPKKITGTRFGAVLNVNKWNSPFKAWCEITRTYEEPFTDSIYTIAGKTIEPKQAEYMRKSYYMTSLKTPEDIYGKDYFKKTYGDFFPDNKIFGGMWDYLNYKNGKVDAVLEMKTTKRSEDWQDDIPEYYALQGALYAYLLGVDDVIMVCSFLEDSDYEHPEDFEPTAENTVVIPFKVSERYPNFQDLIDYCTDFWNNNVLNGISPEYTSKDSDIIKVLKTTNVNPDTDITFLVNEAEHLKLNMDAHKKAMADDEKRYKQVTDMIKQIMFEKFNSNTDKVELSGEKFVFSYNKSSKTVIDDKKLVDDGLFEKYSKVEETYRFTVKEIK